MRELEQAGHHVTVLEAQARALGGYRYDVAGDGRRFLVVSGLPQPQSPITIVTN